jgi:predicted dehydrogenase
VVGSEGQAELLDYSLVEIGVGNVNGKVDTLTQSGGLHRALLEHFMDCYAKGEEFPIDGEEGMKALEIIKAIYLSWSSGRAQSLPLDVSVVV